MVKRPVYLIWSKGNNGHCPLIRSDLPDNTHLIELGARVISESEFWEVAAGYPDYVDFLSHLDRLNQPLRRVKEPDHTPQMTLF